MRKNFMIALAVVATVAAIYFWQQLRIERALTTSLRALEASLPISEKPVPMPASPTELASTVEITPPPASPSESAFVTDSSAQENAPLTFDRLMKENKEASGIHATFLAQPQDPIVAYEWENEWRQYFSGRLDVQQYGTPEIQCGSKFCEIRLLTKGTNSGMKWAQIMFGSGPNAHNKPADDLVSMGMLEENGSTAIVFLTAKRRSKVSRAADQPE